LQNYLTDASNMPGGFAAKLFLPENEADIVAILREANEAGTPVTVSGARTGTVGGAIPFGGIVVSLERLNKIKSIDKDAMTAVVEPGVVLGDFQKAVEAEGLFYPPDPTEWSCQIGGTVATNASGARSFKYGGTREYVKRLRVVLASGEVVELRRGASVSATRIVSLATVDRRNISLKVPTYSRPNVQKNVSGFYVSEPLDAIDLFIGSEGTLGVITEIELRLLPTPAEFLSGIFFFGDEANLLSFVEECRDRSVLNFKSEISNLKSQISNVKSEISDSQPNTPDESEGPSESPAGTAFGSTLMEYFDGNALRFISEKFPETPTDAAGAIFFEQETNSENEDTLLAAWNDLFEKYGADLERSWFTTSEHDREKMREFRHALPVAVNERIVRYKQKKVGTDMAVPDENFASFLSFYRSTLDASGLDYVIFGHIADCHLHANMLPKTDAEAETARHLYGRCVAQAIMLGGVVSAEHGIGKLKRKYLAAMMGERYLSEMAEVKRALDPKGILGRGNMFDESYL